MTSNSEQPNHYAQEAAKILRTIFTNANADAAQAIKNYQGNQLPSFGIMYPQLKELAKKFKQNNLVAEQLLHKNTREAKIMGILLCMPDELTEVQLKTLIEIAKTEELKNIVARHIIAPIIKINKHEDLWTWLPRELMIKGIIQSSRTFNLQPEFDLCIQLITNIEDSEILIQDRKNLAEILYRTFPNKRKLLIQSLQETGRKYQEIKPEFEEWINDFKYND